MTMTEGSTSGGAVYDRGYRPYTGSVGDRWAARRALFRLTVRRALGIRRSWRQKVLPWSLLAIATVPAVVNVGIKVAIGDQPVDEVDIEFISYRDYVEITSILLLFVAVTAPDAICPDRHDRVLPLIFSRPLTGVDYVVAKVAAIAALIFGFGFFPQVVLFVGQTIVNEDGALDYIGENAEVMWQVPASVAVLAVLYAAIGVALSSLTDRRIVGGIAIFGSMLVAGVVGGVLVHTDTGGGETEASSDIPPARPVEPDEESERFLEPGSTFEDEVVIEDGERFDERPTDPEDQLTIDEHGPAVREDELFDEGWADEEYEQDDEEQGSLFGLIDVSAIPLYLRDVVFLGRVDPTSSLGGVEGGAVLALLVYLGVLALSLTVLFWRYREVRL